MEDISRLFIIGDNERNVEVLRALADRLSIVTPQYSETPEFYTEFFGPISGNNQEQIDSRLLADAEREAKRHMYKMASKADLSGPRGELRDRLESGLFWEAQSELGIGRISKVAEKGNQLLRNLKARYACARIFYSLEELEESKRPQLYKPVCLQSQGKFILAWSVGSTSLITLEFRNKGQIRIARAWKWNEEANTWAEACDIHSVEFPLIEKAASKDKNGKWIFSFLPNIHWLVSYIMNPSYRNNLKYFYDDMYTYIKETFKKEQEDETCCLYVGNPEDMNEVIEASHWLTEDDEFHGLSYTTAEPSFWEQEQQIRNGLDNFCPVDSAWSSHKVKEIQNELAPEGHNYPTHKSESRGHKSLPETLVWLLGSKRDKKLGFVSHSALTKEDREILIEFAYEGWKRYRQDQISGKALQQQLAEDDQRRYDEFVAQFIETELCIHEPVLLAQVIWENTL